MYIENHILGHTWDYCTDLVGLYWLVHSVASNDDFISVVCISWFLVYMIHRFALIHKKNMMSAYFFHDIVKFMLHQFVKSNPSRSSGHAAWLSATICVKGYFCNCDLQMRFVRCVYQNFLFVAADNNGNNQPNKEMKFIFLNIDLIFINIRNQTHFRVKDDITASRISLPNI